LRIGTSGESISCLCYSSLNTGFTLKYEVSELLGYRLLDNLHDTVIANNNVLTVAKVLCRMLRQECFCLEIVFCQSRLPRLELAVLFSTACPPIFLVTAWIETAI